MKITQKKQDDGQVLIEAVAEPAEVARALDRAAIAFAQKMGMRPQQDKTVAEVVETATGIKDLDSVVESQALEMLAPSAIDKAKITPAYPPTPMASTPLKRGKKYAFRLYVMPKPEYELTSYDPVEVTVRPFKPDTSQVDNAIREMAERYGEYVSDDAHPVGAGDSCLISLETTKDGEPVPGLTMDQRTYTAGTGLMPTSFDEQVIGMQPGEEKTFTFSGPGFDEDFNEIEEEFTTTVKILEIQRKVIGEIDDTWVKTYMPMYSSVEDMREKMGDMFIQQQRQSYDRYVQQMAVEKLAQRFQGSVPDAIYEAASKDLQQSLRAQVAQQNMTWEQFIESQGGEQQFSMLMMLQTRQTVVQGFALDALFRHAGLVVKDEDLNDACMMMNPQSPGGVRQHMEESGLGYVLREAAERVAASRYLMKHAIVTEVEPTPADAEMGPEKH